MLPYNGQHGSPPGPQNQMAGPQNQDQRTTQQMPVFNPAQVPYWQQPTPQLPIRQPVQPPPSYYSGPPAPQEPIPQYASRQSVGPPFANYSSPPLVPQGNYLPPVNTHITTTRSDPEQRYHVSPQQHYQQQQEQRVQTAGPVPGPSFDPRNRPFANGVTNPPHQAQPNPPQSHERQAHGLPISQLQLAQSVNSDLANLNSANSEQSLTHFSSVGNHRNVMSRYSPAASQPFSVTPHTTPQDQTQYNKMESDVHSPRTPRPLETVHNSGDPGLPSQSGIGDVGREQASIRAAAVLKNVNQALSVTMDLLQDYLTEDFIRFNNAHLEKGVSDSTEIVELKQKIDAANMECEKLARRSKDRKAQNDELQATIKSMGDSHNETLVLLESKEQEIKVLRNKVAVLQKEKVAIAKLPFVQLSALADNSERKASELEGQLQKILCQIGDSSSEQHKKDEELPTSPSPTVRGSPVTPKSRFIEGKVNDVAHVPIAISEGLGTRENSVPLSPTIIDVDAKAAPPSKKVPDTFSASSLPYPPPIRPSAENILETDSKGQSEELAERPRKKRRSEIISERTES